MYAIRSYYVIRFGITGDFQGWGDTLMEAGLEVAVGVLLLPVMRFFTDKILLPA